MSRGGCCGSWVVGCGLRGTLPEVPRSGRERRGAARAARQRLQDQQPDDSRLDHGFSHQSPGFINSILNKKKGLRRFYLPPDANCLVSTMDHVLRGVNYANMCCASSATASGKRATIRRKSPIGNGLEPAMKILVLNAGSGSQKCSLFEVGEALPDDPPEPLREGEIDATAPGQPPGEMFVKARTEVETTVSSESPRHERLARLLKTLWGHCRRRISRARSDRESARELADCPGMLGVAGKFLQTGKMTRSGRSPRGGLSGRDRQNGGMRTRDFASETVSRAPSARTSPCARSAWRTSEPRLVGLTSRARI